MTMFADPFAQLQSLSDAAAALNMAERDARIYMDDLPTRTVRREVECAGTIGHEDNWDDVTPCPFAGLADVAVFDDTEEAIWHCPNGHENSIRWETI